MVVGDLVGSGEAQERGIVGETPNLAARLQGIAEPNAVVIAESTRKLLLYTSGRALTDGMLQRTRHPGRDRSEVVAIRGRV